MFISNIKIKNYRCFAGFEMSFHDGLNVIIGSNNSGKTGLLRAIALLANPDKISIDDFNKNDLQKNYDGAYKKFPPEIIIEFTIEHKISENDTSDESIVKLLSFIGMDKIEHSKAMEGGDEAVTYILTACVKMTYALNPREIGRYVSDVKDKGSFNEFFDELSLYQKHYSWNFTNGISETSIDKKEVTDIFKVDFIEAERDSKEIYRGTKREIAEFLKMEDSRKAIQQLEQELSVKMKGHIGGVLSQIEKLIDDEQNAIGLKKGNVAISQDVRPMTSISDSYVIDVKDTKSDYVLPFTHNGLGYNNLINMYMLIRLVEIQNGKDFRILCLEEPEAHLHPAMQYKLFKFLKTLDSTHSLNQQIFVTTHSPNVTAVAGLENMFLINYERLDEASDCRQRSMEVQLENKNDAKAHMMKFLDVTRSDMLFADKIILVEGITEKLLLPLFMEKCGYAYEDEHVSIVEIGGKHFGHFIELFANNPVKKKVLCITDKDFSWLNKNEGDDVTTLEKLEQYNEHSPSHVKKLKEQFKVDNVKFFFPTQYGTTFEDELFMCNIDNGNDDLMVTGRLLKIAIEAESLTAFIDLYKMNFQQMQKNIESLDGRVKKKIKPLIDAFSTTMTADEANRDCYANLFFATLFRDYAASSKGRVALSILVDEELAKQLAVPTYIKEGIEWLAR